MARTPSDLPETDAPANWLADFPPRRWHLLAAAASLVLIYAVGVRGKWWPTPDSALYMTLARSLAEGKGYVFNGRVNSEVAPGLPAMLAGIELLFGKNFWAPNLVMTLWGLTGLWFIYHLCAHLSDRRTAFAITLATGFSYTYYHHSHVILTDISFTALFWAALHLIYTRGGRSLYWPALAGVILAVAVAIRAPGVALVCTVAVGLVFDRRRGQITPKRRLAKASAVLVPSAIVCGALCILAYLFSEKTPLYVGDIVRNTQRSPFKTLFRVGAGFLRLPFAYAETLNSQEALLPVGIVVLALAVVGGVRTWRRGIRSIPLILVLYVVVLCVMGGKRAVRPRYLMPVAPMLLLLGFDGLFAALRYTTKIKNRHLRPRDYLRGATVMAAVIIACNAPRLFRNAFYYTYASYTLHYHQIIKSGRYADWFAVSEIINETPDDEKVVIGIDRDNLRVVHFLTSRPCVPAYEQSTPTSKKHLRMLALLKEPQDLTHIIIDAGLYASKRHARMICARVAFGTDFTRIYRGDNLIMFKR